ncbi:50S ribosomal protein L5 [Candidatus Berkelbacteria bacterium RBG_13_40_8]|uniref:Large ribosomal subunit protein uL5 n=1 Tax=Candidatus Berkelbacteria bacterium RBG_13_40_8 TaxID=1797467 RepID=A0A1F5DQM5_9BACT|nr:MAG: 50S ribosomal protein L5 [Candidatus Berkelbacteria bacterium RBG_13_40_8]
MSRLKKTYKEQIAKKFLEEGYTNTLAVPKVTKVIVHSGIGKERANQKFVEMVKHNLTAITGQKPALRKARQAIAGFKVREGDAVGLMVTLRGEKMYDFLEKLANVTLPRLRDFRGLDVKGFGQSGNFNLGIKEHVIFPEISHEQDAIHGLEIAIVTTAKNKEDGQKLLAMLGFPFKSASPADKE